MFRNFPRMVVFPFAIASRRFDTASGISGNSASPVLPSIQSLKALQIIGSVKSLLVATATGATGSSSMRSRGRGIYSSFRTGNLAMRMDRGILRSM